MANQPQSRPWFRLPTLARVAQPSAPAPTPAPPPTPASAPTPTPAPGPTRASAPTLAPAPAPILTPPIAPQATTQPPIPKPSFLRPTFRPTATTQPQQPSQPTTQEAPPLAPPPPMPQAPAPQPSAPTRPPPFITSAIVPPLVAPRAPVQPPSVPIFPPLSVTPPASAPPSTLAPTTTAPPPSAPVSSPPFATPFVAPAPSTLATPLPSASPTTIVSPPRVTVVPPTTLAPSSPPSPPPPSPVVSSPQKAQASPRTITTSPTLTTHVSPVISQRSPPTTSQPSHPTSSPKSQRLPPSTTSSPSPPTPTPKVPPISMIFRAPPLLPSSPKPTTQPPPSKPSFFAPRQVITSTMLTPSVPAKPSSPKQVIVPPSPASSPSKLSNGHINGATTAPVISRVHPPPTMSAREAVPLRVQTPPQSPKTEIARAPPSPFTLPPSQMRSEREPEAKFPTEVEKKAVVAQQSIGKPKSYLELQGKSTKGRDIYRKSSDSEDVGMRVITIIGENQGAIMELGYSPKRNPHGYTHKRHGNTRSDSESGRSSRVASNEEARNEIPKRAVLNSNVQGLNSSIIFNSKVSHHDPGLHFSLSRKPINGHSHAFQLDDHANSQHIV